MPFLVAVSDGFYCCLERMFDRSSKIERPVMDPTEEIIHSKAEANINRFPSMTALKRYHYTKSKSQNSSPCQASIMVSSPPTAPPTSGSIIVPLPLPSSSSRLTSGPICLWPLTRSKSSKASLWSSFLPPPFLLPSCYCFPIVVFAPIPKP